MFGLQFTVYGLRFCRSSIHPQILCPDVFNDKMAGCYDEMTQVHYLWLLHVKSR